MAKARDPQPKTVEGPQAQWEKKRKGPRNGGSWTYDEQGNPVRNDPQPKTEPKPKSKESKEG